MTKNELEAFLRTLDIWVIVFGVLVAIGVTGEAIVGFLHFRKGNELNRLEASENLAQQAEIERLKSASGLMSERAANAERQAALALKDAAEANERSNKLELEAAQQKERAAKAEQELLQLKQRMAPREITPEQQAKLDEELRPIAGRSLQVVVITGNPENEAFGSALASALERAGLHVKTGSGLVVGISHPGISFVAGKGRTLDVQILATALIDTGLAEKPIPVQPTTDDDGLVITVAAKKM